MLLSNLIWSMQKSSSNCPDGESTSGLSSEQSNLIETPADCTYSQSNRVTDAIVCNVDCHEFKGGLKLH